MGKQSKNRQMGLYQTKKFLQSQGNNQQRQPMKWENNICNPYI
jgi:hypothetical protein